MLQIHEPAAAQPGTSNATAAAAATSTQHQDDAEEEQREEQEQAAAPQQQQAGPSDPAAQAGVGAAPAGAAPEPSTEAAVQPLPMASTAQLTPPEQCPAGITVEQYLLQESDRMVASIQVGSWAAQPVAQHAGRHHQSITMVHGHAADALMPVLTQQPLMQTCCRRIGVCGPDTVV